MRTALAQHHQSLNGALLARDPAFANMFVAEAQFSARLQLDGVSRDLGHVDVDVARIRSDLPPSQRGSSDQHDRGSEQLSARPCNVDEACDDGERVVVRQELGWIVDVSIVGSS
jgi:hypothetical protein